MENLGLDGNETFWPEFTMNAKDIKTDGIIKPMEIDLSDIGKGVLIVKIDKIPSICDKCVLAVNSGNTRTCPKIYIGTKNILMCTAFGVGAYFIKKE